MNGVESFKSLAAAALAVAFCCILTPSPADADFPLVGLNPPHESLADGDFDMVKSNKRELKPSPFWTTRPLGGVKNARIGLDVGRMASASPAGAEIDSRVLDQHPQYPKPVAGDVLEWEFAARAEYTCDATASLYLVFGDEVRTLVDRKTLPGGPQDPAVFGGRYTLTQADVALGMPKVRAHLMANDWVRVYLEYVDVRVLDAATAGPADVTATTVSQGMKIGWTAAKDPQARYSIYRSSDRRRKYQKVADQVEGNSFVDQKIVSGVPYFYAVTTVVGEKESSASLPVTARSVDSIAPSPPTITKVIGHDAEVKLQWKANDADVKSYTLYRGDADGANMRPIASDLKNTNFLDFTPAKGTVNRYEVRATDYSGNQSAASKPAEAKVKTIPGASFRDLIQPIPINGKLSSDLWGADAVLPRDPTNGIEDDQWSYWGGHPMEADDGKFHMVLARWPEDSLKGHWEWPNSTVVHAVSDNPVGPYRTTGEVAFAWNKGYGHNPGLTRLNDGSYMLHLHSKHVLTSKKMSGPWEYQGTYTVDYNGHENDARHNTNQYQANVVGIHRADGSLIFLSKWGATMISTNGIMGPYVVANKPVIHTDALPEMYRRVGYEDPAFWRDEVQYHMIINGFKARRAVYFRSPDGIHWKFDPGTAYDPDVTVHEDGTRNAWYYLERPHVLQDQYGRATHFSLAVMDVTKSDDYGSDSHSSKNLILPLTVHRRMRLLSPESITSETKAIRVLVLSEDGFNAQTDMQISSLRYGASEEVNFGRGCQVIATENHAQGIVLTFDGTNNGITKDNFAGKMIGQTTDGKLVVGFNKLPTDD